MEIQELLRKLPRPVTERDAWSYGVDCALNGSNTDNCHFSIFSTPERTKQWENGKKAAEEFLSSSVEVKNEHKD